MSWRESRLLWTKRSEYSCAAKPQFRTGGFQISGTAASPHKNIQASMGDKLVTAQSHF